MGSYPTPAAKRRGERCGRLQVQSQSEKDRSVDNHKSGGLLYHGIVYGMNTGGDNASHQGISLNATQHLRSEV